MFNLLKMEIYRMLHTKSFYVIWIVMAAAVLFSTAMSEMDYDIMEKEAQVQQTQGAESTEGTESAENVNIGMTVTLPTQPGEKVTLLDMVYANIQGKFIAIFLVIFAVLFSTTDINTGYIKNIGGQIKNRGSLILAKTVVLSIYSVVSMLVFLLLQSICMYICFGYLETGDTGIFLRYYGIQILLHCAFVLITMMIAVVLKNNVVSIAVVICLCMNLTVIFYGVIDKLVHEVGWKEFNLINYTISGKITMLSMNPGNRACLIASVLAVAFGLASVVLTTQVFRRRDI